MATFELTEKELCIISLALNADNFMEWLEEIVEDYEGEYPISPTDIEDLQKKFPPEEMVEEFLS